MILWGTSCITHNVGTDRPLMEGKSPDHEEYTLTGATIQIEHRDIYIATKVWHGFEWSHSAPKPS